MLDSNQPYVSEQNSREGLHLDFGQLFISVDKKKYLLTHADSDLIPLPTTKIYYSCLVKEKSENSSNNHSKMTGVFHALTSV